MKSKETESFDCVAENAWHYGDRITIHLMECPYCKRPYEHVYGPYQFCPRCGHELTDDTSPETDA